jgi:(p)ppGpp synthase/HD superfamily hydrolase
MCVFLKLADRDDHGVHMRKGAIMDNRPPPREIFFGSIAADLTPNEYERVHFAYVASKYGHAKQIRDDGTRYFDHPKAAAWIYITELGGRDTRIIIDLLLHDLSEDAYLLSPYRLGVNFGKDIALDVHALTKLPKGKETTEEYLGRVIARGPEVIIAKLCDRLHNLRTLDTCTAEKQVKTVVETKAHHLLTLIPALAAADAPYATMAESLELKITKAIALYT